MTGMDLSSLADDVCEDGDYDAALILGTTPTETDIGAAVGHDVPEEQALVWLVAALIDHTVAQADRADHRGVAQQALRVLHQANGGGAEVYRGP